MPIKVAFDVTPLLRRQTGVGGVTGGLFQALARHEDIELEAFAMSARKHGDLDLILPPLMKRNRLPMPAAWLQKIWTRHTWPSIEVWMGRVDVAHGTNFVVPPTRGAAVVTVHDLTAVHYPEMCEPFTLRYPDLIRVAVGRGAHVHTYSQFVADEVCDWLGIESEKIHVIPAALNGLDVVNKPENNEFMTTNKSYVLAVGTVEPRKNYPRLIRAWDAVAHKYPETQLVIAGGRGWGFGGLQASIDSARNRRQIQYVGRVSNVERARLLSKAAVLTYPSIYEGFGLPPLEAMRAEVPVIASNAGALPEVLGDAALLVDPSDEKALSEAIDNVLSDQALRSQLIAKGDQRWRTYAWAKSGDKLADLYKELAS